MATDTPKPSPTSPDLESLIMGTRNRDTAAFAELIQTYEKHIVALLWSKGHDRETIEDITQETYIAVWEKIDQLQSADTYIGWVSQIAINNGRLHANKVIQRKNVFERYMSLLPINILLPIRFTAPTESAMTREREKLVREAIAALPEEERSVFTLRHFSESTYPEISQMLGLSESVVRNRLEKANGILKTRLGKLLVGGVVPVLGFTSPLPKVLDMIYSGKLTPPAPEFLAATATAAAAGSSKIASFLMYFAFPFLWLMSILVSGHVCAHKFVTTAPTLAIRRWLMQQSFYCYCLLVMIPLTVLSLLSLLEGTISHSFMMWVSNLFFGSLFVFMLARFYWLNVTFKKYRENTAFPQSVDYASLSRQIHYGFVFGTALLIVIWFLDFYQRYQILSFSAFWWNLVIPAFLIVSIFLLFHLGSYCLYRYYLALSKDEVVFQKTFINKDWSTYSIWDELCYLSPFLMITLGPQIFKFIQAFRLSINGTIELFLYFSVWCVVIVRNRTSPKTRWKRIWLALAAIMAFMILIRQTSFHG